MSDTYFKLPRSHRWLEDVNTPENIGGRPTDVGSIGLSLEAIVKNLYPINGVPDQVALKLGELRALLDESEKRISQFIEQVSQEIWYSQLNGRGY